MEYANSKRRPGRRMVASMRNGRTWVAAVMRRLGRSRRADERGAVLVEAAIVIPVLMLITLGIIEYGSAYQQDAAVAAASRSGVRAASALSKSDFGCATPTTCPLSSTDSAATVTAAVSSALQAVGSATPQKMYIYDPTTAGTGPPNFTGCTHCVGYTWVGGSTKAFSTRIAGTPGWFAANQDACAADPPDQITVWVSMTHQAVTRLFGGSKTLTGSTTMRFEPNVTSTCGGS